MKQKINQKRKKNVESFNGGGENTNEGAENIKKESITTVEIRLTWRENVPLGRFARKSGSCNKARLFYKMA